MRRGAATEAVLAAAAAVAVGAGAALAATTDQGAGPGSGDAVLGPGPVEVELVIEHSRFSEEALRVRQGTEVTFVVVNDDPIRHELIVGPPEVHRRHEGGTEAEHPPRPGEVTVDPLETASTTYAFDEVGVVEFACHLPGHVAYGMVGTVEVVPA